MAARRTCARLCPVHAGEGKTQMPGGREDISRQLRVRLEVQETGIGIAPDHMERLFHVFEQADASITR